ncbi:hypothetical protein [Pseudomonas oryzihabitans]|uniref:hypothetical protein n=1 Tax=Pseudomonas oryzihabitans TaxID=47885 RepID=UPI00289604D4|nr:hypothetical protein [Pseudomonas oryzihabitans]MDT3721706.1 hypothetical protein [Pseudomonas oryzihabitans]
MPDLGSAGTPGRLVAIIALIGIPVPPRHRSDAAFLALRDDVLADFVDPDLH